MSGDDPFAEPDDTDKTVIRPNPGGRRTAATMPAAAAVPVEPMAAPAADTMGIPAAAAAPQAAKKDGPQEVEMVLTGMNQLTASAAPLFSLISRIRNRAQHMDPDKLRSSVVAEVRAFENRALQASVPAQTVKIARYSLCATLDDVVLNTPWGGQSSWGLQSMVGTFHRETVGGDRFYDLLARLEKEPGTNLDVLEFIYMCLSLGFEGRLRVEQGGPDKHLQIRQGLARIIRGQRGDVERDLSPHWEGEDKPFRALSAWRLVWIALGTTAALLALQFTGLSYLLGNKTERLIGQLSVIDNGPVAELQRRAPPPPPTPPDEVRLKKVVSFLQKEIDEGIVNVFQKGNTLVIRIAGSNMFGSGSDQLTDKFVEPIARVANALNDEVGPVIITGHSDNIPIKSSRFPSNMHLSLARAKSVMSSLTNTIKDPKRLSAEGRAEKEPIADNSTRDGRAENRRIEVLLVQEAQ